MSTRFLPARHFKPRRSVSGVVKKQLPLGGDMATCEAARVLHSVQEHAAKHSAKDAPEDLFAFQCRAHELPTFARQHLFAKEALGRRWQFDFAWLHHKLAVEIEGLVMRRLVDPKTGDPVLAVYGRHATITGFKEDCVKYASAAQLGWTVLRFEQSQVKSREAIDFTMRVLCARGWNP